MNAITFLRIRPCNADNELYLNSRRREGTSSFLIEDAKLNIQDIHQFGFQTIAKNPKVDSFAWIMNKNNIEDYKDKNNKLLIYELSNNREEDYEIISRMNPALVFSKSTDDLQIVDTPSFKDLKVRVSSYVDTIDEALNLASIGVSDLWLRDWNNNDIEILSKRLGVQFLERTVLSPFLDLDEAREVLPKEKFSSFLSTRDVRGYRREEVEWAPGKDIPVPDSSNISSSFPSFSFSNDLDTIISSIGNGAELTDRNLYKLFHATGSTIDNIAKLADEIRNEVTGDEVSFVINRNINYTNQCYYKCGFCGFSKGPQSLSLKEKPYSLEISDVVERSKEAVAIGASEVCLQGGIHPEYTGKFYIDMVKAIRQNLPDLHIHGFTPLEIWQGAETIGLSIQEYLHLLKNAGLNTLPGTAAEILDDRVRKFLCPDKITSSQWAYVMEQAHSIGIKSTATIMFGHIDDVSSWVNHFSLIRNIQKSTRGFTEIVPLPFVHMGAPIFLAGKSMPGPTWDEVVLIHSLARIYFYKYIDNIQASWVKLGLTGTSKLLSAGVNDLGGTLMNENISRAAGADHGQGLEKETLVNFIYDNDKTPTIRDTLYNNKNLVNKT